MNSQKEIKEAVVKEVPKVQYNDSLRVAIKEMTVGNTSAVVVINNEEVVGIISDTDIVHSISNGADIDEAEVINAMTSCELVTGKGAITPCVQLDEDESITSALHIMNEAGVHNLLVSGANDKATGLVSARDLLKLLAL